MTAGTMTPEEFFQQHPRLYGLALAGPALTCGYALARMRGAADRRQVWGYGALAAVTAVQFLGLLRWRPDRLARLERRRGTRGLADELDEFALACPALAADGPRSADEILGYDDVRLPR